jgi:peptidoglycan/LPS O-acetylase OafA/YrhL
LSHGGLFAFGASGVHLFFVLSGFLILRPYAAAILDRRPLPSTSRFFARRALRILPAYWFALLVIAALAPTTRSDFALHLVLLHNWSEGTIESINPPFWTMAIESQFYLLVPVLGFLLHRAAGARDRAPLASLLLLVATTPFLYALGRHAVERLLPDLAVHAPLFYTVGYLFIFAAGGAASLLHVAYERNLLPPSLAPKIPRLARLAGALGLGALLVQAATNVYHPATMDERKIWYWIWSVPLLGFGYSGLVLGTLLGFPSWKRAFSRRGVRFVGVISYSLYIWNIPLFKAVVLPIAALGAGDAAILARAILGVLLVILPVSYASYMLIERPAFALRFKLR